MNWWQWGLAGWFGGLACFVAGCWWGGRNTPELEAEIVALAARNARLRAGHHPSCANAIGRLSAELATEAAKVNWLGRALVAHQAHIDYLEGRPGVVAEAEQILEQGGGS
jgi:hypothetical protein